MVMLLIIGTVMIASGFFLLYMGRKRNVPNFWLWAVFPIFHGLHEYAEYFVEENFTTLFSLERIELLLAFTSTFILVAAAIEFNGFVSAPLGKTHALFGLAFITFFLFVVPDSIIQSTYAIRWQIFVLKTDFFRIFYGFILVIAAALIMLLSLIYRQLQAKHGTITLVPHIKQVTYISVILLLIFSIFEGFESENAVFLSLRGISLLVFTVVVPSFVILSSKLGLQTLLVIDQSGNLIYAYDFPKEKNIFEFSDTADNQAILMAGLLAALSSFSEEILKIKESFSIKSGDSYFTLVKENGMIFAINSLQHTSLLDTKLKEFAAQTYQFIREKQDYLEVNATFLDKKITEFFSLLY